MHNFSVWIKAFGINYFAGQDVKANSILPNSEFFKSSVDVFSIHGLFTRLPRWLMSWLYQELLKK